MSDGDAKNEGSLENEPHTESQDYEDPQVVALCHGSKSIRRISGNTIMFAGTSVEQLDVKWDDIVD